MNLNNEVNKTVSAFDLALRKVLEQVAYNFNE